MIFGTVTIIGLIAKLFIWKGSDEIDAKKYAGWVLYGVLVIIVLFVLFFAYKGCSGQRTVKIDTEAINKINNANEEKRKKELKEIVIGTQEVIDNSKATELEIDKKVEQADKQIRDIRETELRNVTADELERILSGIIE